MSGSVCKGYMQRFTDIHLITSFLERGEREGSYFCGVNTLTIHIPTWLTKFLKIWYMGLKSQDVPASEHT